MSNQRKTSTSPLPKIHPIDAVFGDTLVKNLRILSICQDEGKSIIDISEELVVSKNTIYNNILKLLQIGLLETEGSKLSTQGGRSVTYKSTISEISLIMKNGIVEIKSTKPWEEPETRTFKRVKK